MKVPPENLSEINRQQPFHLSLSLSLSLFLSLHFTLSLSLSLFFSFSHPLLDKPLAPVLFLKVHFFPESPLFLRVHQVQNRNLGTKRFCQDFANHFASTSLRFHCGSCVGLKIVSSENFASGAKQHWNYKWRGNVTEIKICLTGPDR